MATSGACIGAVNGSLVAAALRPPAVAITRTITSSPPGNRADVGIVISLPVTSTAAGIQVWPPSALHNSVKVVSSGAPSTTSDNGTGFDPSAEATGSGVINIRDRLGSIGGGVDLVAKPGSGVTLRGYVTMAGG